MQAGLLVRLYARTLDGAPVHTSGFASSSSTNWTGPRLACRQRQRRQATGVAMHLGAFNASQGEVMVQQAKSFNAVTFPLLFEAHDCVSGGMRTSMLRVFELTGV